MNTLESPLMHLRSNSFKPYDFLPERLAFGKHDPESHFTFAGNRNPHLAWDGVPDGTQSIAIVCYDPDAPSEGDDVNQEGKTVSSDLPRMNFFHWILVDLPADLREIAEGAHSEGITAEGKQELTSPDGGVCGANDYTDWFSGQEGMEGVYYGYDGMAPPWNDERVHAYHFAVFALDVKSLGLQGSFTGAKAMRALRSHVLSSAELVGLYAINPATRAAHAASVEG